MRVHDPVAPRDLGIAERIQDRSQEEERQEQSRDQELDVPEQDVQRRDREREAGRERDDREAERNRQPFRRAHARQQCEVDGEQRHEHHGEADQLRRDDGKRHELPGKTCLANEVRVVEQRARCGLHRGREEEPRREADEQKRA